MAKLATYISAFCVLLFLAVPGTVVGQDFEESSNLSDYNWRGQNDSEFDYGTTAEILTDSIAFNGSNTVALDVSGEEEQGALVNDNQQLSPGDSIDFKFWASQDQLDQMNLIQPFIQWNGFGDQRFKDVQPSGITPGEWNTIGITFPDTASANSTSRIGIQVVGDSADTATFYIDYIERNGDVLPVEMVSFDAVRDGHDVTLRWKTASEANNAGFDVQFRRKGAAWETAGFVEGAGTTSDPTTYSYSVSDLVVGQYVFRLRQVDVDGSSSFSSKIPVEIPPERALELSEPHPNPFQERARFTLSLSEQQEVHVGVYNILGQRVATLHDGPLVPGTPHSFTVKATDLPSGVYFVRGQTATRTVTHRVVLSR